MVLKKKINNNVNKENIMNIKIKHIQVILASGPDTIILTPDLETPFPNMKDPASLKMDAQKGYGIEWVRKVFGREPDEIISSTTAHTNFFTRKR